MKRVRQMSTRVMAWRNEATAVGWLFGADLATRVTGQVAIVVTARLLGPQEYGALAVGLAVYAIVAVLADLGIGESAAQRLTRRDKGMVTFWHELGALRLLITVPLMAVGLLVSVFGAGVSIRVSGLLVATIPFATMVSSNALSARISERFSITAAWTSILLLGQWVGALAGAFVLPTALSASLGVSGFLIIAGLVAGRHATWRLPSKAIAMTWLNRGRPFLVAAVAVALYSRGDRIVIAAVDGSAAAGVYTAAYNIIMLVAVAGAAMHIGLLPRLLHERRQGSTSRWRARVTMLGAAAVPAAVLLWVISPRLMAILYGHSYNVSGSAGGVLRALSPLVLLYVINPFLSSCLIAAGGQAAVAKVAIANVAVAAVAYPLLTVSFGIVGTAWASVIIETVGLVMMVSMLQRVPLQD